MVTPLVHDMVTSLYSFLYSFSKKLTLDYPRREVLRGWGKRLRKAQGGRRGQARCQ